jgi:phosphate starvation-inducible membrane PsiE
MKKWLSIIGICIAVVAVSGVAEAGKVSAYYTKVDSGHSHIEGLLHSLLYLRLIGNPSHFKNILALSLQYGRFLSYYRTA